MTPIRAVLFDCDGVLADSEGLVNALVAEAVTALGWPMTGAEAEHHFLGLALPDIRPLLVARVGPLPPGWDAALGVRIQAALARELRPIAGAAAALAAVAARGLPMAVCSNSSRAELRQKLKQRGRRGAGPDALAHLGCRVVPQTIRPRRSSRGFASAGHSRLTGISTKRGPR